MKKFRKIAASALCLATVISASACNNRTTATTTTTAATTSNTLDDDLINPVNMEEYVDEEAEALADPNLTYFGYYDMRVAGDIKPAVKLFEETYGGKIDYIECAWGERIEKLQVLISSGDSPDLVDKEDNSFPLLISKNVYEDLTDYIDLSQPQWAGFEELIEQYSWNGKHCYYPWFATALCNYVYYSNTRFEEFGITTPRELYENGEWTWDTFKDTMIKFIDASPEETVGVYGNITTDTICSTGTPLVSISDGKIVNNMKTPEVERAMTFLEDICRQGLTAKKEGYWGNEIRPLAEGSACFLSYGQYQFESLVKERYAEYDFDFVPFPRDPNADEYYYMTSTFGYMVPSGSDNVEGAATFIDMIRLCSTDPDLRQEMKSSTMTAKGWSEEQYDRMAEFEKIGNYNIVADFSTGFDTDTSNLISNMLIDAAFNQDSEGWPVLRDTNINVINTVISEMSE